MIYFDHNATSPLHPAARDAWLIGCEKFSGNPSSPHRLGARAEAALEDARSSLAKCLLCDQAQIVWTSGATESINTVLHGFIDNGANEVWVSSIEHPAVLNTLKSFVPRNHRLIPVSGSGIVDLNWLRAELALRQPAFVVVMAANNETGVLQPWREILHLCQEWEVPFVCDATQWIGRLPGAGLGECDFVAGSAHKFGGPKGVGFLKVSNRHPVKPLISGGAQQFGLRAGTENVPGVLGMMAALEAREKAMTALDEKRQMQSDFQTQLAAAIPELQIVGQDAPRLWNTISVIMPEVDCRQRWVVKMDRFGFAVSTGSACSSGLEAPSRFEKRLLNN